MMFDDFSIKEPYRISGIGDVRTGGKFKAREGNKKKGRKKSGKGQPSPPGGGGRISIKV